ncbi:MAG: type I restriction-modification system subunit M [Nitrosomonadales bacterium]|nr:type I restriction-modification system subunit M [Nitrosomonadales bacterium]
MAIKKSELYSALWQSCDELRGGMDASQYKDYVLALLFVKYVSDKYANDPDAPIEIPQGGSFADMVAAKNDKEIGEKITKIASKLAAANSGLLRITDFPDFNDEEKLGKAQAMVERLTKLVAIFEGLDFARNRAEGDDLLGDAYEYLMRHFATESGKSKGQFYTPAEVSRVMSMVIGLAQASSRKQTIHDPTCGSGSLLLKAHDEARNRTGFDLALYGQEMDNATSALARMNMVLHDCTTAIIWQDNTLAHPYFTQAKGQLKTFDFVVANPPFSTKAWSHGFQPENDEFNRFEYGIPPDKNGDYAFLLHILASLKSAGKGAVILPHGVLFRGGAEAAIRKRLVTQGYIKGIIGLPANLFYGTGIPACIIVLDKEGAAGRKGIFMIDASKGYIKDGNKNRLREQDIHQIVDAFNKQLGIEKYSRMLPLHKIEAEGYNLNLPRYIDSSATEDLQDIAAHLKGGIPNRDIDGLSAYWQVFPSMRRELFSPRPQAGQAATSQLAGVVDCLVVSSEGQGERVFGYSQLKVAPGEIKSTVFNHAEFASFHRSVSGQFAVWLEWAGPLLKAIEPGNRPKVLAEMITEELLKIFAPVPLFHAYDVYQHLMDYWAETMQDDVYLLASDGWQAAATVRRLVPAKDKNGKSVYSEAHDFMFDKLRYKADLIPPALIVARYFAAEQAAIETLEAEAAAIEQQVEELREEHGGEEGLLAEVMEDGKIAKGAVTERLKEIKSVRAEPFDAAQDRLVEAQERKALVAYQFLIEQHAVSGKKIKDAQQALDMQVFVKYGELSEAEIKALVVDDKWLADITAAVQGELERVSQTLTGRIMILAERYATPLPVIAAEVEELSAKVESHLIKMGFQP